MTTNMKKLWRNQSGIASILITMVTLIVISLIVLGFATVSRREQSNTLDQQLSTQAFYAAETAVNDARALINAHGGQAQVKDDCVNNNAGAAYNYPTEPVWLNGATKSVGYTCLIVNPTPGQLEHDSVSDAPWVAPVASADGTTQITRIQIQWTPTTVPATGTPSADCPSTTNLKTSTNWKCGYGLLRMDLVPTSAAALSTGRTGLANNQLTGFFVPQTTAGSSLNYSQRNNPNIAKAQCTPAGTYADGTCTMNINGLSDTSYTLRLLSWYHASNITVTAYNGSNPVAVNGQVLVDATGVASGVLRRIEVRLPTSNYNGDIPEFAIQSNGSICKRFATTPGYFDIAQNLPTLSPDTSDPMCQQTTGPTGTPSP